jgi:hypothetical protein
MLDRYKPKYKWCETWRGENRQDFIGLDHEEVIGRIHLDQTTPDKTGLWRWNVCPSPWVHQRIKPPHGWAETRRNASRLVETHYEKLKKRTENR